MTFTEQLGVELRCKDLPFYTFYICCYWDHTQYIECRFRGQVLGYVQVYHDVIVVERVLSYEIIVDEQTKSAISEEIDYHKPGCDIINQIFIFFEKYK